ncbi:hypothetical protein J4450_03750 [Candidatus Micrarchaeota archaeon]|nr:hypothetical protein [Candidatus Micrarchaeota archaeon]
MTDQHYEMVIELVRGIKEGKTSCNLIDGGLFYKAAYDRNPGDTKNKDLRDKLVKEVLLELYRMFGKGELTENQMVILLNDLHQHGMLVPDILDFTKFVVDKITEPKSWLRVLEACEIPQFFLDSLASEMGVHYGLYRLEELIRHLEVEVRALEQEKESLEYRDRRFGYHYGTVSRLVETRYKIPETKRQLERLKTARASLEEEIEKRNSLAQAPQNPVAAAREADTNSLRREGGATIKPKGPVERKSEMRKLTK